MTAQAQEGATLKSYYGFNYETWRESYTPQGMSPLSLSDSSQAGGGESLIVSLTVRRPQK
jgi:hypothetical protein